MNARLRLVLVSTLIVVAVLILIGATYQGVATALERRRYPHPGQLVDVGGHQLHIYCVGEGSPIVVLEAPAGTMSAIWGWVQPQVAKTTRVCSYDRAGLGWSEAGDKPYDPGRVPEELHALLAAAKQPPPYVLVGHSLGASFVRAYAGRYSPDVMALVLVDPPSGETGPNHSLTAVLPWFARVGLLRASNYLSDEAGGLPARDEESLKAFFNRPDHLTRAASEVSQWREAVRLGDTATVSSDVNVRMLEIGRRGLTNPHLAKHVSDAILQNKLVVSTDRSQ